MGNEISRLFVVIGARTTDFEKGLAKVKTDMKLLGATMTGIGVAITGTLAAITISWSKAGNEVAKLSDKTGFATETLSELRYAAQLSGSSLSGLEIGIKRMQSTIIDARNGLGMAITTLRELGLSYEKLKDLSPEEQFTAITNALADIPDPTLKAALAVDIFGRSGTDMLPMLSKGSDGLEEMRQEAHNLGLVFSSEAAQKAEDFNDSLTRLKGAISGLGANIAEVLAPIVTNIINKISSVIQKVTEWARQHPALIGAITTLGGAVGILCATIGPLLLLIPALTRLLPLLGMAFHAALGPIGLITLAISGLIALGTLLITNWSRVVAYFCGPAALAAYELKRKIDDLADAMITGVKIATKQIISNLQYEASVERSILEQRQAFWKSKQYEKIDILDEVMLAEIKAIDPILGAKLEAINEEIKGIDAAGEARQRQADEDEAAAIRVQLKKLELIKGGSKEEKAQREKEKADLNRRLSDLEDYWHRKDAIDTRNQIISEANLDSYYADQQAALDIATSAEIQTYKDARDAFIDKKSEQLEYLENTWIPEYKRIMAQAGIEPAVEIKLPKEEPATGQEWWRALHPLLSMLGMLGLQQGGIVRQPTLSLVGEAGPEAVIPLSRLDSISGMGEIHNHYHIGTVIADDMSLRKFWRMLNQIGQENGRRNFFNQVQKGYGTGTSSL